MSATAFPADDPHSRQARRQVCPWSVACGHVAWPPSLRQTPAFAHATLIKTDPADGAVLAQGPRTISLTFSEPVSPLVLTLVRPDGTPAADSFRLEGPDRRNRQSAALGDRHIRAELAGDFRGRPSGRRFGGVFGRRAERRRRQCPRRRLGSEVGDLGRQGRCSTSACSSASAARLRLPGWPGAAGPASASLLPPSCAGWSRRRCRSACRDWTRSARRSPGWRSRSVWHTGLGTSFGWTVLIAMTALGLGLLSLAGRRGNAKLLRSPAWLGVGSCARRQRPCQCCRAAMADAADGVPARRRHRFLGRRVGAARSGAERQTAEATVFRCAGSRR